MKIAITGTSRGLGKDLFERLNTSKFDAAEILSRIESPSTIDHVSKYDVLINNAHSNFEQTIFTYKIFELWKYDPSKYIITIGSRASEPNISKGYLYASSKSSLQHLHSNLTYNSDKKVRMTYLSLGLINSTLPSITSDEVFNQVRFLLELPIHLEMPFIGLQHVEAYEVVQQQKAHLISQGQEY